MATDSTTDSPTRPDASELRSSLTEAFGQVDTAAAGRVQLLQQVYQARASLLSRRADELMALYGAKDSGVKSVEAAIAAARTASSQLTSLHLRFTTPDPDVAPDGWVLHGRVFNESREPMAGFTVFFVDAAKAYKQAYGYASTDDTGYFLLRYGSSRTSDEGAAGEGRGINLFVEVTDLKGRLAYLSDTAFQPVAGATAYQDIVLTESGSSKGAPPAKVREVGMPKRKSKR